MRREELYIGRRTMQIEVQMMWKIGRPKRTWLDRVRGDINENGLAP